MTEPTLVAMMVGREIDHLFPKAEAAAIGMSMIIISGHIEVSVGALIGVLATISGTLAVAGYPVWGAWGAPIVVGAAVNAVVGALVAYGRIPSIVVTLGMLSILRGGLVSITGGAWISNPGRHDSGGDELWQSAPNSLPAKERVQKKR